MNRRDELLLDVLYELTVATGMATPEYRKLRDELTALPQPPAPTSGAGDACKGGCVPLCSKCWIAVQSRQRASTNDPADIDVDAANDSVAFWRDKFERVSRELLDLRRCARAEQQETAGEGSRVLEYADAPESQRDGADDDPTCSRCHGMVIVADGCEWEPGDMCDRCLPDAFDELNKAYRNLAEVHAEACREVDRLRRAAPATSLEEFARRVTKLNEGEAAPGVTAAVEASDNATVTRAPGGRAVTCLAGYRAGDGPAYTCERSDARHVTHVDGRFAWTDADNRAAPPRSDDIRDIWVSDNGNLRRPNIAELEEILAQSPAPARPATAVKDWPEWKRRGSGVLRELAQPATVGERKLARGWRDDVPELPDGTCMHRSEGRFDCRQTPAYYLGDHFDMSCTVSCELHAEAMGCFATPEAAPIATPPAPRLHHPACLNDKNHTGQCLPVSATQPAEPVPTRTGHDYQGDYWTGRRDATNAIVLEFCAKKSGGRQLEFDEADIIGAGYPSPSQRHISPVATPPVEPPRCKTWCGVVPAKCWIAQHCTPECRVAGKPLRPVTKDGTP